MKALKIRIYPNQVQQVLINKTIGSCRFIYNSMLAEKLEAYNTLKDDKRKLFEYKYKTEKEYKSEFEWLKEVDSIALQQSRMDLSEAYQNFFKSLSNKRKGKSGFPKFHKKGRKDSYRTSITNENIKIDFVSRKVKLPKLGWLNFRDSRNTFNGNIKQATVSRTCCNKYFVSILFEQETELNSINKFDESKAKIIGLDMSLSNFFVDDKGNSPMYEKLFRINQSKLKRLQRRVSRKQKGSNKRQKAQLRVNLLHESIVNKRKDFTQKLSTQLVKDYNVIVVENLNLRAMAQCLNLGKSINDLGYGSFLQQLKYKSEWNNTILIEADKWFASSKTCSKCGFKHKNLKLSDRTFTCPECNFTIDRDQNAGINLKNYGLNQLGLEQSENTPEEFKTKAFKQLKVSLNVEPGSTKGLQPLRSSH